MRKFGWAFLVLVQLSAYSQGRVIQGKVQLPQKEEAVLGANIVLYREADSSLVKIELSDPGGFFKFTNISPGDYRLQVSYVGFQTFKSSVLSLQEIDVQLETISLQEENEFAEVLVKAQRPLIEVLADRTVFQVEGTLSASGLNGLELLRKAPGIVLDNQENVLLDGKTGVRIWINDRPSYLQGQDLVEFLRSLSSSDIASIDIISQPSARYDAAGSAGIINIRLKKDTRLGTQSTLTAGYGYGRYGKGNSSILVNHRSRRSNLYGSYNFRGNRDWSFLNLYREQVNTIFDQKSETIRDSWHHQWRAGYDYTLSSKQTIGILVSGHQNRSELTTQSRTPIRAMGEQQADKLLMARNTSDQAQGQWMINANYRWADTLGRVFNIDVDGGWYQFSRNSFQPNFYRNGLDTETISERTFRMITPNDLQLWASQAEYEVPWQNGKLSMGGKFSSVQSQTLFSFFDVKNGLDAFNPERSNTFNFNESIAAGFIRWTRSGKKWDTQLGVRWEQTFSSGNLTSNQTQLNANVRRKYGNVFPSAGLTYVVTPGTSWGITYSKRIERPAYSSLNPFEWPLDELTYQKGNAFLLPQYTDNLKVSFTHQYQLTTSLSYSYVHDFFAQITDTTDINRNFLMERNIADQQVVNLGVSYPFQVRKNWQAFVNLNAYHTRFTSTDPKFFAVRANVLSLYAQNTWSFSKNWRMEVSGWYSSPGVWGGTYLTRAQGSLDLALQKSLSEGRGTFRLIMSDVFFTSPWRGVTQFGGIKIVGSGGWESRTVRIAYTYQVGNLKIKTARARETSSADESGRI